MSLDIHLILSDGLDLLLATLLELVLYNFDPVLQLLSILLLVISLLDLVVLGCFQLLVVLLHEVGVQTLQPLLVLEFLVEFRHH